MGIFTREDKGIGISTDTDTLTRAETTPDFQEDDGGHDRFAHYIKKEKIVESAVT
jgi:hypothetical protein